MTDETRNADDVVDDDLVRRRGRAGGAGSEAMNGRAARRRGAKVAKTKQAAKTYEPTPEERAAMEAYLTRRKERRAAK